VRLGSRSPDEFIKLLNKKNETIQNQFLSKILELTKTIDAKVMMGDSTLQNKKHLTQNKLQIILKKLVKN